MSTFSITRLFKHFFPLLRLNDALSFTWTAQWVYVSAPFLGAIAGALLYRWMREAGTRRMGITLLPTQHQFRVKRTLLTSSTELE